MPHSPYEERAARAGATLSNSSARKMQMPRNATLEPSEKQVSWHEARSFERQSHDLARAGLTMRGADRFNALALASTFASAARVAGCGQ